MNWLKYSGCIITIVLNPHQWRWVPQGGREFIDEWAGPNQKNWRAGWLFVTVRFWIDDGSW
jgi:hypothetical protein